MVSSSFLYVNVQSLTLFAGECPFWSPEEAIRGLYQDSRAELALRAKSSASPTSSSSSNESPLPSIGMSEMVDIVIRCLEVDPQNRPTADQVLDHSFISGSAGWRGYRGWE